MSRIALGAVLLAAAFGATTWWALESGGVAVVETSRPEGGTRATHVWHTEMNGALWLEAGTPENSWYRDVQRTPILRFTSDQRDGRHRAHPDPDPERQRALRSRLRAKYGWRDRFVGLFVDSGHTIPVRLDPIGDPAEPTL